MNGAQSTISTECAARPSSPVLNAIAAVDAGLARAVERFFVWRQRMADRQALRALDDHMLHDIGLSRLDVEEEARKPFWRG